MEFHSAFKGEFPHIPDDLTIPQFFLDEHHDTRPKRPESAPWVVADKSGKSMGLAELKARTRSLSASLRDQFSIGKNNVVLMFSSNHIDYPICIWAIHQLLGIVAPFNPASTVSELVQHLKLSKATLIITHENNLPCVYAAAQQVGIPKHRVVILEDQDKQVPQGFKDSKTIEQLIQGNTQAAKADGAAEIRLGEGEGKTQIAFYGSSSGTTGVPKIVQITHYGIIASVLQIMVAHRDDSGSMPKYQPGDRCLAVLPFYHIYGILQVLHFNFFAAQTLVVVPKYNVADMLQSIDRYKINSLMLVPPQIVHLCKESIVKTYNLSHIRTVICGAAPLSEELNDQLHQLIPQAYIVQGYGSTEAGTISMTPVSEKRGKHAGAICPGTTGRVVKHDGTLATYNEEGELHVRTPGMALGYLDNESANLETFLADSWMKTGDLVKINTDGEVIVVDRIKEMIKVRGFQVAPAELEGCLLDHPFVADACVVGVPHPISGEAPFAFITLTEEANKNTETDIKASINKHIATYKAPYKWLYHIEITSSIPKTPSGKLLRRELREKGRALLQRDGSRL